MKITELEIIKIPPSWVWLKLHTDTEHNEVNDTRDGGKTIIGKGFFKDPFILEDNGCVALPDGPGLGVELDEPGLEAIMKKNGLASGDRMFM